MAATRPEPSRSRRARRRGAPSTLAGPLVAALGVGLSTGVRGRGPVTDGPGTIVPAGLLPFVPGFGTVS